MLVNVSTGNTKNSIGKEFEHEVDILLFLSTHAHAHTYTRAHAHTHTRTRTRTHTHTHSLIIAFTTDPKAPPWKGYFYALLMFVATLIQTLSIHQHWDIVFRVGMRIRTAVVSAVYSKVCLSSVCLFVHSSVCPSVSLSHHQFVCPSISLCLSVSSFLYFS